MLHEMIVFVNMEPSNIKNYIGFLSKGHEKYKNFSELAEQWSFAFPFPLIPLNLSLTLLQMEGNLWTQIAYNIDFPKSVQMEKVRWVGRSAVE